MKNVIILLLCMGLFPLSASALDTYFASPRAMGMGGANVASVKDTSAQYYNPAAFGFMGDPDDENADKYGVDIGLDGGYRLHSDFAQYVDDLNDIDLDALEDGIDSEQELQDLTKLAEALDAVDEDKTGITADGAAALGIRAGRFAIGVRSYAAASGRVVSVDTVNLGIDADIDDLNSDIESVDIDGYDTSTYEVSVLTEAQVAALSDAGYSDEAIKRIDYVAADQDLASSSLAGVVDILADVADSSSSDETSETSLSDNTTTIELDGISIVEVPISYGYRVTPHIAVGGNFKVMRGRVYKNQVSIFEDDAGDALSETDEHFEETTTFGIDLGVMAHYGDFSLGLMGRNLNSPKFDGFSKNVTLENGDEITLDADDVTLDPQVTAGVAWMPIDTFTLEANLDLLEGETVFPGYDTQNLSLGLEWNAFHIVALRLGAYKNLANDDVDLVYTAGLGLNLWLARLDIAGAYAADSYEYDGEDVPQEAKIAAALSVNF